MNLKKNSNKLTSVFIQFINWHIKMRSKNIKISFMNITSKIWRKLSIMVQEGDIIAGKQHFLPKETHKPMKWKIDHQGLNIDNLF